jgi:hypothetical protein
MPKLTADLFGAPDGEIYPRTFRAGEDCPASLEEAARVLGILDEMPAEQDCRASLEEAAPVLKIPDEMTSEKAQKGAPENKARE